MIERLTRRHMQARRARDLLRRLHEALVNNTLAAKCGASFDLTADGRLEIHVRRTVLAYWSADFDAVRLTDYGGDGQLSARDIESAMQITLQLIARHELSSK